MKTLDEASFRGGCFLPTRPIRSGSRPRRRPSSPRPSTKRSTDNSIYAPAEVFAQFGLDEGYVPDSAEWHDNEKRACLDLAPEPETR